jgi:hypothetical protein
MSTEENMDSTNVETISESPTEPEAPVDVSVAKFALDVYIPPNIPSEDNQQ